MKTIKNEVRSLTEEMEINVLTAFMFTFHLNHKEN